MRRRRAAAAGAAAGNNVLQFSGLRERKICAEMALHLQRRTDGTSGHDRECQTVYGVAQ